MARPKQQGFSRGQTNMVIWTYPAGVVIFIVLMVFVGPERLWPGGWGDDSPAVEGPLPNEMVVKATNGGAQQVVVVIGRIEDGVLRAPLDVAVAAPGQSVTQQAQAVAPNDRCQPVNHGAWVLRDFRRSDIYEHGASANDPDPSIIGSALSDFTVLETRGPGFCWPATGATWIVGN